MSCLHIGMCGQTNLYSCMRTCENVEAGHRLKTTTTPDWLGEHECVRQWNKRISFCGRTHAADIAVVCCAALRFSLCPVRGFRAMIETRLRCSTHSTSSEKIRWRECRPLQHRFPVQVFGGKLSVCVVFVLLVCDFWRTLNLRSHICYILQYNGAF